MNTSSGMQVKIVPVSEDAPKTDARALTLALIDVRIRALKQELAGLERLREELTRPNAG